jgi:hypothetical protein
MVSTGSTDPEVPGSTDLEVAHSTDLEVSGSTDPEVRGPPVVPAQTSIGVGASPVTR